MRGRATVVRRSARLAAFAFLLAAAGTGSIGRAAGPATQAVDIAKFAFVPREITIEPGTRVRWTNHDETPHTVTSPGAKKLLASPGMDTDDSFEFVFGEPGDYPYLCVVHPMMTGVVHVRKLAGPAR